MAGNLDTQRVETKRRVEFNQCIHVINFKFSV